MERKYTRLSEINGESIYHADFIKQLNSKYKNRYFNIRDVNFDDEYKITESANIVNIIENNFVCIKKAGKFIYLEIRLGYPNFNLFELQLKPENYVPEVANPEREEEFTNAETIAELKKINADTGKDAEIKINGRKATINTTLLGDLINNNVNFTIKTYKHNGNKEYYINLNNGNSIEFIMQGLYF